MLSSRKSEPHPTSLICPIPSPYTPRHTRHYVSQPPLPCVTCRAEISRAVNLQHQFRLQHAGCSIIYTQRGWQRVRSSASETHTTTHIHPLHYEFVRIPVCTASRCFFPSPHTILTIHSYTVVGVLIVVAISSYAFWILAPKENRTYVLELYYFYQRKSSLLTTPP